MSVTLMVWLTGADTLPQASVAIHVLVTECAHWLVVELSVKVIVTAEQLSVAVGAVKDGVAGQLIVNGPPCPLRTGAVLSITVIVCEAFTELLHPLDAVHVLFTENC